MQMNNPIGNSIQAGGEARHNGRTRVVSLLLASRTYDARVAHREAQQDVQKHRGRATAGARGTIANLTDTLFRLKSQHRSLDPAREHDLKTRRAALADPLENQEQAAKAYDRLLTHAATADNVQLAGGIAEKALTDGWEEILGHWVATPGLGGDRGGRGSLEAIRAAQRLLEGELPVALQDLPAVEDIATSIGRRV